MTSASEDPTATPGHHVVQSAALSDVGRRREENQDSFRIVEGKDHHLFIVADGMGGVRGGAVASQNAIEEFTKRLAKEENITLDTLTAAVQYANRIVFEKGSSDPALAGMGTTFVCLAFHGTTLLVTNVGDSRAYRIREGKAKQITQDHTLVMELLRTGAITADQAESHPVSHMLTRSLGPTPDLEVDCWTYEYGPARGDRYLLCSDGLYNLVSQEEIGSVAGSQPLEAAVKALVELANARGGTDNITVILFEVGEEFPVTADQFGDPEQEIDELPTLELEPATEEQIADGAGATNGHQQGSPEIKGEIQIEQLHARKEEPRSEPDPVVAAEIESRKVTEVIELPITSFWNRLHRRRTILVAFVAAVATGLAVGFLGGVFSRPDVTGVEITAQPAPAKIEAVVVATQQTDRPPEKSEDLAPKDVAPGKTAKIQRQPPAPEQPIIPPAPEPVADASTEQLAETVPVLESTQGIDETPPVAERAVSPVYYNGLTRDEAIEITRRKNTQRDELVDLEARIRSFDQPITGSTGESLREASGERDQLYGKLDQVRTGIDQATRELARWYGRRKRLQSADPLNLAGEIASVAPEVKAKKEAFEGATWVYLREAELLRQNPSDLTIEQKVNELARARKDRLSQVADEVRRAIDDGIRSTHEKIADLTVERDKLESALRQVEDEVDFARVLMGSDRAARDNKRLQIMKRRDRIVIELDQLERLLPQSEELLK